MVWFSIYVRWKIKNKHFEWYNSTCISNKVSDLVLTGQMLSLGVPSISMMSSIWWMSDLPGSRGRCARSSPNIHPVDLSQQVTHVLLVLLGSLKIVIINTRILGLIFTSFRFVAQLTLIGKTFQLQTSSFKTKDQTFFKNQKSWEILWNTRYHTLRNITNRFTTYLQQLSALWLRIKVLALCTL